MSFNDLDEHILDIIFQQLDNINKLKLIQTCETNIKFSHKCCEFKMQMCEKLKAKNIKILTNELNILKYTIEFIKKIISQEISIEGMPLFYIIDMLDELNFPKLLCGEYQINFFTHEVHKIASFGYIIDLKLCQLSQNNINKLEQQFCEKKNEIKLCEDTTMKDWWKEIIKKSK